MYQRLYVPVDDSHTSHRALDEATKLAKESGGMVRLVHVVDLAQFGWGGSEFWMPMSCKTISARQVIKSCKKLPTACKQRVCSMTSNY